MAAAGFFRRRVAIATRRRGEGQVDARCALEDEFHHFRVRLEASEGVITAVCTDARRTPNSLCEAAGHQLQELVGMALDPACASVLVQTDQYQQCTHQLDLAGLGVAAMASGRPRRIYEVTVPDRREGRTIATLAVDGNATLRWQVQGMVVEGPAPYEGQALGRGFTRFTRSLGAEEAEAALVLRRALFVSRGRGVDLDTLGRRGPVGGCWAWQPERMDELRRLPQNRRDFSSDVEAVLADDASWLDFSA